MTVALTLGLLALAGVAYLVAWIWTLIVAFRVETRWGLLLLIPPLLSFPLSAIGAHALGGLLSLASLVLYIVFLVQFWPRAKQPFFCLMGSLVALGCAALLGLTAFAGRFQQVAEGLEAAPNPSVTFEFSQDLGAPNRPALPPKPEQISRRTSEFAEAPNRAVTPELASVDRSVQLESPEPWSAPELLPAQDSPVPAASFDPRQLPLTIECATFRNDPRESLQFLNLALSNASPKTITGLRMRLIYLDNTGHKVGEWTSYRALDQNLEPYQTTEVLHCAAPGLSHAANCQTRQGGEPDRPVRG